MPNKLYPLLLLLTVTITNTTAQVSSADLMQKQVAVYSGGQEALAREFLLGTRYPASAQRNKKFGTVLGVITVSRSGETVHVGSINKALPEFRQEFERVARNMKGGWTALSDTAQFSYAVVPIQFSIPGDGYTLRTENAPAFVHTPILISAHWAYYHPEKVFDKAAANIYRKKENDLENQVDTYVRRGEYEKAIEVQEELLNLQPLHLAYYQSLISLYERVGNEQEAAYYREVVQLFTK